MATFVYYPLWDQTTAQYTYDGIRQWFKDNPDRDDCKTESCTVRRSHIKEDILANSEKDVVLQEKPQNKDFKDSLPEDKPKKAPKKKKLTKKAIKAAATAKKPTKKAAKKSK